MIACKIISYVPDARRRRIRRLAANSRPDPWEERLTYLWVAVGGALGSMARFWMTGTVAEFTGLRFPWGTLLINVSGSVIIGWVAALTLVPERLGWHPDLRVFLMTGFCGGYTTFSAFSLQTFEMLQVGEVAAAAAYMVGSVVFCVAGAWLGFLVGRP